MIIYQYKVKGWVRKRGKFKGNICLEYNIPILVEMVVLIIVSLTFEPFLLVCSIKKKLRELEELEFSVIATSKYKITKKKLNNICPLKNMMLLPR